MKRIVSTITLLLLMLLYSCSKDSTAVTGGGEENNGEEPTITVASYEPAEGVEKVLSNNMFNPLMNLSVNWDIRQYSHYFTPSAKAELTVNGKTWTYKWTSPDGKAAFTLEAESDGTKTTWKTSVTIKDENIDNALVCEGYSIKESEGEVKIYDPKTGDELCSHKWSKDASGAFSFTAKCKDYERSITVKADKSGSMKDMYKGKLVLELTWNADGSGSYLFDFNGIKFSGKWDKNGKIIPTEVPEIPAPNFSQSVNGVFTNPVLQGITLLLEKNTLESYKAYYTIGKDVITTITDTTWEKTWTSPDGKKSFTMKGSVKGDDIQWSTTVTDQDAGITDALVLEGKATLDKSSGEVKIYDPKTGKVVFEYSWSTDSAGNKTFVSKSDQCEKTVVVNADKSGSIMIKAAVDALIDIKWNADGTGTYTIKINGQEYTGKW